MTIKFLRIWFNLLIVLELSSTIIASRKEIGFPAERYCRTTVQGRHFLSDENGYLCDALSVDPQSRCCPEKGEKFSCQGCDFLSQCCNSYEYCVTCCLNPARTEKEQVLKVKIGKPSSSGTYGSVFDYCTGRCRHNSESVVHENAYVSDYHHCFSLPSNSSEYGLNVLKQMHKSELARVHEIRHKVVMLKVGLAWANSTLLEARLNGINVVVGRQGESCNLVCKARGQSCVPNKLSVLNQCDIIQKHMNCKDGCLASMGPDQPAEVVPDAPRHLNPGSCLYTQSVSMLSCDGLHQHTRRLCPCA